MARCNPRFLSNTNLNSIFAGNAYIAIAAIGMSMVIISGHIDVSVGSLIGVLATIAGHARRQRLSDLDLLAGADPRRHGRSPPGSACLVAYVRIPSIVVTLGMLSILEGRPDQRHGGRLDHQPAAGLPDRAVPPFGIPSAVWFMVGLTVIAALFMRYTAFGRAIYAIGGNMEAARVAGITRSAR